MLGLRVRIAELASYQPGVPTGDSGARNSSADLQTIVDDEPQNIALDQADAISSSSTLPDLFLLPQPAIHDQLSGQERGPLGSVGVIGSLLEGADPPFGRLSQVSSAANNPSLPQDDTYSEGQTLADSSKLLLPSAQSSQEKVMCSWPGCSRLIKKENRTRHVNEMHWRKVKAVCAGCGKEFARPYMKRDHIRRAKCKSS
ncbi:uncharacterized protein EDB91DRAFT_1085956 [Suillus paluster]|uniref:uncharacterized protein n=1 Tax=Suillus paluster TaxID=48578 RepID=UPI001B885BA5|nr:uncharacterized protein EDB91DRAFT_1085956 [Suillus paluster]KAG1728711.1 hypothetical protein EDB91DRAFT_1085956 [Suillus paluster]